MARNSRLLVALTLLTTATLALVSWLADGYWRGLVHGGFLISMAAMVRVQFWAHTGAFTLLLGGQGEDDTRAELQKAARSGRIHGWIDSIELERYDIDHLVATPAGWYALDTKWRGKPLAPIDLDRDASSAARAASKAHSVLRAHRAVAPVRPAVVVWGGAVTALPAGGYRHGSGVDFIPGRHLIDWLDQQPEHQPLPQAQADELLAQLRTFRDQHLVGGTI